MEIRNSDCSGDSVGPADDRVKRGSTRPSTDSGNKTPRKAFGP